SLNPFASDHVPFIQANIPAVLTIEGKDEENHNEHTSNDTLDLINYELALDILKMNVAFIVSQLKGN
ncbi:M28 family peptidase, partial [Priestia sp. BR_2]